MARSLISSSQVARCVRGDTCDRALLERVVVYQETIVHLAAEAGTEQSMHAVHRCEEATICGTALPLDSLINQPKPAGYASSVAA